MVYDPLGQDAWERTLDAPLSPRIQAIEAAQALLNGRVTPKIPWTDPNFQRALIEGIGLLREHREDARKLAVIKEVFGGAK